MLKTYKATGVNDFKNGTIRYFAIRDEKGEYVGTVEVTQNIKPVQEISGEKRIMD